MEELKTQLHNLIDSIDNPKILSNLNDFVGEYIALYSNQRKNEEEQ